MLSNWAFKLQLCGIALTTAQHLRAEWMNEWMNEWVSEWMNDERHFFDLDYSLISWMRAPLIILADYLILDNTMTTTITINIDPLCEWPANYQPDCSTYMALIHLGLGAHYLFRGCGHSIAFKFVVDCVSIEAIISARPLFYIQNRNK